MKALTVKEVIDILKQHDENMIVIVTRDGNGHDYPIVKEYIEVVNTPYFPNSDVDNYPEDGQQALRIGLT